MPKLRLPIAFLMLAIAVLAMPLIASADNSWSKYHWDISTAESATDPLVLGDNTSTTWTSSLEGASTDWNQSVLLNTITAGNNTACDPVLGGVEVCNDTYGTSVGWLGIAQVWVYRGRDGHIAQALVKVNDSFFDKPEYNSSAWRDYVMCQEVGHTIGLSHQDETFANANLGTCMDYTDDPDGSILNQASNLHPNQHDLDVLYSKYGHLNGVIDEGGDKPEKGNNGGGNGKKNKAPGQEVRQWGKAISTDGKGRPDLFELDLGGGNKLFTHVLWAN
ncbi:MAG: hypothetical protein J4N87_05650 [Chloroflexi bacterium]|nr:hypothetical protein [Chloroflexota bacterium]